MTIQEQIADLKKRAANNSLPDSAKAALKKKIEALEAQAQSHTPDYDKLLHKEKAAAKSAKKPKSESKTTKTKKAKSTEPKPKKEPKVKATRAPKERKATKTKPADTGSKVDRTDMSAKFVAEFVKMLDKPVRGTRLVSYLKRLQKAIYDLQVRKKSRYANLIYSIQSKLVRLLNGSSRIGSTIISLSPESRRDFADFFADNNYTSAKLLKEYVGLQDSYVTAKKAKSLVSRMEKALQDGRIGESDPFKSQIQAAIKKLEKLEENERMTFSASELRGLGGLLGSPK